MRTCEICGCPLSAKYDRLCVQHDEGYELAVADVVAWLRSEFPGQLCSIPGRIERGDAKGAARKAK